MFLTLAPITDALAQRGYGGSTFIHEFEGRRPIVQIDPVCLIPLIEQVASVELENGEVIIEVTFDDSHPLPHTFEPPYNSVEMLGGKFDKKGRIDEDGRYIWVINKSFAKDIAFQIWDPCEEKYFTEGVYDISCTGGTLSLSDRFEEEWNAFVEVQGQDIQLNHWLNNLDYLTTVQRWSFFQKVYGSCEPVSVFLYGTTIPDEYALNPTNCQCSTVRIRRSISPGNIRDRGSNDANPFVVTDINYFLGAADLVRIQSDVSAGPAKRANITVGGHPPLLWSNEQNITNTYGNESGSLRTLRVSIRLVCRDGDAIPSSCGCNRKVKVRYAYRARLYVKAKAYAALFGGSTASATVNDWGSVSYDTGDGVEIAAGVSIMSLAASCEKNINSDFVSNFSSFIGSLLGVGLQMNDSTKFKQQTKEIVGGVGSLASLITTDPVVGTPCHENTANNNVEDSFTLTLRPNQTQYVYIRSSDQLYAGGKKMYEASANVESGYRLSFHVAPLDDQNTPIWCCSEAMGMYITDGFEDDGAQDFRDDIAFYFDEYNLTIPTMQTDAGFATRGASNARCVTRLDALKLSDLVVDTRVLYDIDGRIHRTLAPWETVSNMSLTDGIFFLTSYNKDKSPLQTNKLVSQAGRILRTAHHIGAQ